MNKTKKVWIPALIALFFTLLLLVYYFFLNSTPDGERRSFEQADSYKGFFTTLGTIALYIGAASFSWFWFKKKLKSRSIWVRKLGMLLHETHTWLGWASLIVILAHGTYFMITKLNDKAIYSGLGAFVILLAISGYGFFIKKIRNKWMRTVHRSLGILWVPVLLLHAGGSTIVAVLTCLSVFGLTWGLERFATSAQASQQSGE